MKEWLDKKRRESDKTEKAAEPDNG
jgi:hypothetical protein